jgi:hypothetical protein
MKYRKKPVVIEAVQWLNRKIVCPPGPMWFCEAEERGDIQIAGTTLHIKTINGVVQAKPGEWVIQGVKGELYPCDPDIFEATYELAEG